jgi:hypothetical protein
MDEKYFKIGISLIAIIFTLIFSVVDIPPLIKNPDVIGAFAAGFVNPYSSGYSIDVFCCWAIFLLWVIYEFPKIKYGWVCLILGIVPGVAVGLALYLLLRMQQLNKNIEN